MRCPKCSYKTDVIDSREDRAGATRRRRRCASQVCGHRFSTWESPERIQQSQHAVAEEFKIAKRQIDQAVSNLNAALERLTKGSA